MATRKKAPREPRHHYEALGVDRGSTAAEVKAAWMKLSRELHPDRHLKDAAQFTPLFARVSQAWAIIGDAKLRKRYDAELDMGSKPCGDCKGEGRTWKQQGFSSKVATTCPTCAGSGRTERKVR